MKSQIEVYVKKPVKVEVFHVSEEVWEAWKGLDNMLDYMPGWVREAFDNPWDAKGRKLFFGSGSWYIRTLEGDHEVKQGDYIIRGIKGELYPCKPDIFKLSYDVVKKEKDETTSVDVGN